VPQLVHHAGQLGGIAHGQQHRVALAANHAALQAGHSGGGVVLGGFQLVVQPLLTGGLGGLGGLFVGEDQDGQLVGAHRGVGGQVAHAVLNGVPVNVVEHGHGVQVNLAHLTVKHPGVQQHLGVVHGVTGGGFGGAVGATHQADRQQGGEQYGQFLSHNGCTSSDRFWGLLPAGVKALEAQGVAGHVVHPAAVGAGDKVDAVGGQVCGQGAVLVPVHGGGVDERHF